LRRGDNDTTSLLSKATLGLQSLKDISPFNPDSFGYYKKQNTAAFRPPEIERNKELFKDIGQFNDEPKD
jgi:hypothetical protein